MNIIEKIKIRYYGFINQPYINKPIKDINRINGIIQVYLNYLDADLLNVDINTIPEQRKYSHILSYFADGSVGIYKLKFKYTKKHGPELLSSTLYVTYNTAEDFTKELYEYLGTKNPLYIAL